MSYPPASRWQPCPEPECVLEAALEDTYVLESTDGPVIHIVLLCAAGHHFNGAADLLNRDETT